MLLAIPPCGNDGLNVPSCVGGRKAGRLQSETAAVVVWDRANRTRTFRVWALSSWPSSPIEVCVSPPRQLASKIGKWGRCVRRQESEASLGLDPRPMNAIEQKGSHALAPSFSSASLRRARLLSPLRLTLSALCQIR